MGGFVKEEYRNEGKSCKWTFERILEAYEKVAKDEIGRLGKLLWKSTDFFFADHRASPWNGRSRLCRMFAHIATVSLWRTTFGGCRRDTEHWNLWRSIQMESTQQDIGGAAR